MIRIKITQEESEVIVNEICKLLNLSVETFKYKNNTTRIFATCNVCGYKWDSSFKHFVKLESKCKICNNIKNKKLTFNEVVKNVSLKNPKIKILDDKYVNCKSKLHCVCLVCNNQFESSYDDLINSSKTNGCVECEKRKSWIRKCKTQENFENDIFKVHGEKISIIGNYTMGKNKVETKCNICGLVWFPKGKFLIAGGGCPDCGHKKNRDSTVKNINWLKNRIYEKHKDRIILISDKYINAKAHYNVKCNICNYEWKPTGYSLKYKGCPICNLSNGEMKIKDCLDFMNIKYEQQKSISKKTPKGGTASFDFYLPEFNCAIEYDGEQHYISVKRWGGDKRLLDQQNVDNFKNEYCYENNIKLIRIPYYELTKINNEYLKNKIYE